MKKLKSRINSISPKIRSTIFKRLKEFEAFKSHPKETWFSELCFCLLTANARASTAINIQNQLGHKGFSTLSQNKLTNVIKQNKHRFHNNKAKYILEARPHQNIKQTLKGKPSKESREFLVNNIKGLGYKEASHFLRNTGTNNLAILDRHILNLMKQHSLIDEIPKSLTKNNYLKIENKFNSLASTLKLTPASLDLYMWYLKTGTVLK